MRFQRETSSGVVWTGSEYLEVFQILTGQSVAQFLKWVKFFFIIVELVCVSFGKLKNGFFNPKTDFAFLN